jgi:hypothetical protein
MKEFERKLPLKAKIFGITTLGAAAFVAACGGKMAKEESPSQPPILPTTTEAQIPPTATLTSEPEVIAPEQNLIKDPSFESGDWRNYWDIAGFVDLTEKKPRYLSIDNSQFHSGAASLRLTVAYDQQSPYEPQGVCNTEFLYAASTHGFYPVSEIPISPGTYELGMWVKSAANIQNYSVGISFHFFLGQETPFRSLGDKTPLDWQRTSVFIQVPPEVTTLRPHIGVIARPETSDEPCGTVIDVWFDGVSLALSTPPQGAEVFVLTDPYADEKFQQILKEKTRPLEARFEALSPQISTMNSDTISLLLAEPPKGWVSSKEKLFTDYSGVIARLVNEYDAQKEGVPEFAGEVFNLAKDFCSLIRDNFPKEFLESKRESFESSCNLVGVPLVEGEYKPTLGEQAQTLFQKAGDLYSEMSETDLKRANNISTYIGLAPGRGNNQEMFDDYYKVIGWLMEEYGDGKTAKPEVASKILDLTKDVCRLIRDYLPKELNQKRQNEGSTICDTLK